LAEILYSKKHHQRRGEGKGYVFHLLRKEGLVEIVVFPERGDWST